MQIILNPNDGETLQLKDIYSRAFRDATELYIASAYLTDWDKSKKLGKTCKHVVFIVGTDFGLSRKAAMRNVLGWLPKRGSCLFLAAPQVADCGFHPKVIVWRSKNDRCFAIIGSSNLTRAGFDSNCEANVFAQITDRQFDAIVKWLEPVISESVPVTEDWIENHYKEARLKPRGGGKHPPPPSLELELPSGVACEEAVQRRRKQQSRFHEIGKVIADQARKCAAGDLSDSEFWSRFWDTWSNHASRFQGSGIQRSCKDARWSQACAALITILDAGQAKLSDQETDAIVCREIERLAELRNSAKRAWFSEMLCHYFPNLYPVLNSPVQEWLKQNKWRARRGSSDGQRYIELSRKLRHAVKSRPAGARNLAELDHAIWSWVKRDETP